MIERKKKGTLNTRRMLKKGKKKSTRKWLSLDSIAGKTLCILLVVILTVGAFLAPKMINNLYDAGTLMQITYMDLDLSTYVVPYVSFQEKLMAVARVKTTGERLAVLPAEETDEKISDQELADIVSLEIERSRAALMFTESWWSGLTEENLVSRQKVTAYAQTQMNGQESSSGWEMAPIQFWILSFEATQEQELENMRHMLYGDISDEEITAEEKERIEEEIAVLEKSGASQYATDRLIVCLDAEFYKIYAMAVAGDAERILNSYGWDLLEVFRVDEYIDVEGNIAELGEDITWGNWTDLIMYLTDQSMADWADYWEVEPENKRIYLDIPGEISGCMVFLDEQSETDSADAGADEAEAENVDMAFDDSKTETSVGEAAQGNGIYIAESAEEVIETDQVRGEKGEILLEAGSRGSFDKMENGVWIQKSGCREFFEMMQF